MFTKSRLHIILWIILALVNFGFAINIMTLTGASLATTFNTAFLLIVFYGNYYWIFPRYFELHNTKRFFLYTVLFLSLVALVQWWVDIKMLSKYTVHLELPAQKHKMIFVFFRQFFWLWLVDLISIFLLLQERIKMEMVQGQKMKEEKLNTELKLLKAQINPHFVFNALNNIYSLTYTKSPNAPESILKLSQMLRYVLEECSNDKVPLRSEVEYIQNFIDFQRIKSPNEQNIRFEQQGVNGNQFVAPMLFIPFIENSFKYSKIEEDEQAFVHIRMQANQQAIHFEISNSIPELGRSKSGAGTGINNVKQRLKIIYPENHTLEIKEENRKHTVTLGIKQV